VLLWHLINWQQKNQSKFFLALFPNFNLVSWSNSPDFLLSRIFGYLNNERDICACQLVYQKWNPLAQHVLHDTIYLGGGANLQNLVKTFKQYKNPG
jgi:hypothetical protein